MRARATQSPRERRRRASVPWLHRTAHATRAPACPSPEPQGGRARTPRGLLRSDALPAVPPRAQELHRHVRARRPRHRWPGSPSPRRAARRSSRSSRGSGGSCRARSDSRTPSRTCCPPDPSESSRRQRGGDAGARRVSARLARRRPAVADGWRSGQTLKR